jgi:SRSO17 transposase
LGHGAIVSRSCWRPRITAKVKCPYVGCAGQVTNAIKVVYASHATPRGHAIVTDRPYLPKDAHGRPGRQQDLWRHAAAAGSSGAVSASRSGQ